MSFVPPAVASQPVRPPKPSYLAGCTAGTSTRPVAHPQTQSLGRRAGPAIMLPEGAGYEQSMEKAVASFRKAVVTDTRMRMLLEQQQQHRAEAEIHASLSHQEGSNLLTGFSNVDLRDPFSPAFK